MLGGWITRERTLMKDLDNLEEKVFRLTFDGAV